MSSSSFRIESWLVRATAGALLALSVGALPAQPRTAQFRRLSPEDGLPAGLVHQTIQDSAGFIWLATQDGLSRYDGYEFVTYRHDPGDPASLPHNDVLVLLEDAQGRLWVGTDGGGLSRFEPSSHRFVQFQHDPTDPTSLSGDRVRVMLEDRHGALWIGTDGRGLDRLDPGTGRFTHYRHRPSDAGSLASDEIRALAEDGTGQLWVATAAGGISVLDPSSGRARHYRHDPNDTSSLSSDRVRTLYFDHGGTLWVGTYDAGLNRFDPETGRFERFASGAPARALLGNRVQAIVEDSNGTLWVGTESGLNEWVGGRFVHHRHDGADRRSLNHDSVVSLFEDRGQVLWVGTLAGVATRNVATGSFLHYRRRSEDSGQLSNNFVTSFAAGADNTVWVGTLGGLNRLDVASGEFSLYLPRAGDTTSLSDHQVMSLMVDRRQRLWVGTLTGGISRLQSDGETFRRFRSDPNDATTLSGDGITAMVEDHTGAVWVGVYRGGVNRFDPESERFTRYRHAPGDPSSLSSDRVTSVFEDEQGVLWVGTDDAGLNRLDRERGLFTHFTHDPADATSLSGDDSWLVRGDADGDLWVATRGAGLNRWAAAARRRGDVVFEHYGRAQGLAGSVVNAVLDDGRGGLWLSTNEGISRFDLDAGTFTNYDVSHGLQSKDFNFAAAARIAGRLYFGGSNGFNSIVAEGIATNHHLPPVVLTDFLKFNKPVDVGSASELDHLELDHRDSVIAFEFAALDYTAPEKNAYRYRLEGFDRDWVDAAGLRHATYTNLDPGSYVFRVQASNSDGLWNRDGLAIAVTVAPAPWRSWWANALYALALGTLLVLVVRALERRRRRARELQRINRSLEAEIEARRGKERALEEEKLKAREYLDVAEVVMVAIDVSGRVLLVNQKGCRLLGYPEQEIVGSDWLEKFVPLGRREEVRQILKSIDAYPYCEYPIITREGEQRVIAWHSTQLPAPDGGAPAVLSSGTDNTEVRKLERQLRMQQKMDALGTLAGGIAHDFNNILTAILGYSTLTLSQLGEESEEAGYMRHVVKGCERARDMVARILTFSRRETPDRKPVELGPVVEEACDLLRSSLPPSIDIRAQIESDCLPVNADPTQIHQVIMNLGTNASHAMPHGGLLVVRLAMTVSSDLLPGDGGGESRPGASVYLTVSDDGQGMDKATLERIFDPFFTTKQVGSGTGLGLSVAHGIVSSHQGEISVRSVVDRGTVVLVRLPCTAHAVARARSGAAVSVVSGGCERILLVDDETPILLLARKWLEGLGYSVEPHKDGVEALASFRSRPRRFDLLVTDQSMPEMEGFELIHEARRLRPELAVVLTSGRHYQSESDSLDCFWLQKPFTEHELAAAVRSALDDSSPVLRSVS